MVVETRIRTAPGTTIRFNVLGLGEERGGFSCVHLRCTVTLEHATRRLRGSGLVLPDRVKPDFRQQQQPSTSDEVRDLRDPSILPRPDDVLRAVLDMLASVPGLRGVDLSDPAAWDGEYAPRRVAGWLHEQGSRWLAGPERERRRCRFEVDARLKVTLVFSEPRAVLRRCAEVAMQTVAPGSDEECGICLDEFRNGGKSGPVNLPCSHAFHAHCMLTWLDRGTNCPACRHDLTGMVAAPWAAPTRTPWVAPTTWAEPTPAPASSSTTTARWRGSRARGRR